MLQRAMENVHLHTAKEIYQFTDEQLKLTVSFRVSEISLTIPKVEEWSNISLTDALNNELCLKN